MRLQRNVNRSGFGIVDAVLAMLVLGIIVIGATAYRYWTAVNSKMADTQSAVGRAGLYILDAWRGSADPNNFFSTSASAFDGNDIDIDLAGTGPTAPFPNQVADFGLTVNGFNCFATLSWKDENSFVHSYYNNQCILRAYNISISYPDRGQQADSLNDTNKDLSITVYSYLD